MLAVVAGVEQLTLDIRISYTGRRHIESMVQGSQLVWKSAILGSTSFASGGTMSCGGLFLVLVAWKYANNTAAYESFALLRRYADIFPHGVITGDR